MVTNLPSTTFGMLDRKPAKSARLVWQPAQDFASVPSTLLKRSIPSSTNTNAGLSKSIPAHLINQVCGSGLRSVISGFQSIKLNEAKYIISGGQENMSIAPHSIFFRDEKKISEEKLVDTMIYDGLIDSFNNYHMGVTAENVAKKFDISREEQDTFALNSQTKTQKARCRLVGPTPKIQKIWPKL